MTTLTLPQLPTLNEYIAAMNRNRFIGNKMKRESTEEVAWACIAQKIRKFDTAVELHFIYREKNAKRDPDNVVFAKKFILDGMVEAGVLPNDTQKYIKKFTDEWMIESKQAGITVIIKEWHDDRVVNGGDNTLRSNSTV